MRGRVKNIVLYALLCTLDEKYLITQNLLYVLLFNYLFALSNPILVEETTIVNTHFVCIHLSNICTVCF